MVTRIFEDCSSTTGWSETDYAGSLNFVSTGGIMHYDGSVGNGGRATLKKSTAIFSSGDFKAQCVMLQGGSSSAQEDAGFYVSDGTNYVSLHLTGESDRLYYRSGTNADLYANAASSPHLTNYNDNEYVWLRMVYTSGVFTFYIVESNTRATPAESDWVLLAGTLSQTLGAITEYGFSGRTPGLASSHSDFDNLQIIRDGSNPVNNSVIDNDTLAITALACDKTVGEAGEFLAVEVDNGDFSLLSTIATAAKTVITAYDTVYYNRFFQGVLEANRPWTGQLFAYGWVQKLSKITCNYNPVYLTGEIEHVAGTTIYKKSAGTKFESDWSGYNDKLIVFKKLSRRVNRLYPVSLSYIYEDTTAVTPFNEYGGIASLFYEIPDESTYTEAERGWYIDDRPGVSSFIRAIMNFEQYYKSGVGVEYMELTISFKASDASNLNQGSYAARVSIYDDNGATWQQIVFLTRENMPGMKDSSFNNSAGEIQHARVTYKTRMDATSLGAVVNNYINIGSTNTYGYAKYTIKISLSQQKYVAIDFAELVLYTDTDHVYEIGVGKIQTTNANSLVLYGNASISWLDEDNIAEGIGPGDQYFITDKLSDIMTTIWTNLSLSSVLTLNFAVTDEIPEIKDLTDDTITKVLQNWMPLFNGTYAISYTDDPVNNVPTLNIKNTYSAVVDGDGNEITLDETIIHDWKYQSKLEIDYGYERNVLKLVGKDGESYSASLTPEHTINLGNETEVVINEAWETTRQLRLAWDTYALLHQNARHTFTCIIYLDEQIYDLSQLDYQKKINVKIPAASGSYADYTSGGSNALFIKYMHFDRESAGTGWKNKVTLVLELRFS